MYNINPIEAGSIELVLIIFSNSARLRALKQVQVKLRDIVADFFLYLLLRLRTPSRKMLCGFIYYFRTAMILQIDLSEKLFVV